MRGLTFPPLLQGQRQGILNHIKIYLTTYKNQKIDLGSRLCSLWSPVCTAFPAEPPEQVPKRRPLLSYRKQVRAFFN